MQFEPKSKLAQETHFFFHKRLLIIGFLFITALGIRLYHINEPPLNFHAVRQYHSLIIAREYYFETVNSIPEWKKQVASISKQRRPLWEPPIMEIIVSLAYRIVGGEHFWIPRLLSSIFWLIGGGFLYLIARKIACRDAAVFSTAFYLFFPFAVSASRSFQPDPLMVTGLVISTFTILQYYEKPSILRLLIAAIVSALAIFIKGIGLFPILISFVFVGTYTQGFRKMAISLENLIFFVVALLPTIIFYSYRVFISKSLLEPAQGDILPHLLLHSFFWKGWLAQIGIVVGYTAFIGALLGTFMFRDGLPRGLIMGLWSGYFVFGLVFSYTIHTHDYWNLQIIPIVALSLGPLGISIVNSLNEVCTRWHWRMAVWSILLLALLLSIGIALSRLVNRDFEHRVRIAQEIGERVNHSTKTVYLSYSYGLPLEYHGLLSGLPWPLTSDFEWERLAGVRTLNAEERYNTRFLQYSPEYFIIEDLRELEEQEDLKDFLIKHFTILAQKDDYLIFDLRKRAGLHR